MKDGYSPSLARTGTTSPGPRSSLNSGGAFAAPGFASIHKWHPMRSYQNGGSAQPEVP